MVFNAADLRTTLLLLTGLAFASGVLAAGLAIAATLAKGRRNPIIDALRPSQRVDEHAAVSAAQYDALKAGDEARLLNEAAQGANQLNRWAASLTILSATLSAAAGFLSALIA